MKFKSNSISLEVWNRCYNWKFESAWRYAQKLKPEYKKAFGKYYKQIEIMSKTYGDIGWLFRGKIANKISKWFGEFDDYCDQFKTKDHLLEDTEDKETEIIFHPNSDIIPDDETKLKIQKQFNKNFRFIQGKR